MPFWKLLPHVLQIYSPTKETLHGKIAIFCQPRQIAHWNKLFMAVHVILQMFKPNPKLTKSSVWYSERLLKIDLPILNPQNQHQVCPPCALITAENIRSMQPMTHAWKSNWMAIHNCMRSLLLASEGCWCWWRSKHFLSSHTCSTLPPRLKRISTVSRNDCD